MTALQATVLCIWICVVVGLVINSILTYLAFSKQVVQIAELQAQVGKHQKKLDKLKPKNSYGVFGVHDDDERWDP